MSFNREPSASEFYRLAAGEAREIPASRRPSHDSATTVGAPETPAPSTTGLGSPRGSGGSPSVAEEASRPTGDPSQRLAGMPPAQRVAVLRDVLRSLGQSQDYIAIGLLLADLGRDMESQVPDDASLDLSYAILGDAVLCAEHRHGPHEGDYKRPNLFMRLLAQCRGRPA